MSRIRRHPSPASAVLDAGGIVLLDGGTGSELRRRGVHFAEGVWSAMAGVENADRLCDIHRDYIAAGAEVVTANTFAATRIVLEAAGLGARFEEINRTAIGSAVKARRQAGATSNVAVAASLSCYPPGADPARYPQARVELEAYRDSVRLFEEAGAELILVEMIQETVHGSAACRAAAESSLPFWLGLSCRRSARRDRLVGFDLPGHDAADTLARLVEFGPAAIAVMHSPPDVIADALRLIRDHWSGPIGAYPAIPYREDPQSVEAGRTPAAGVSDEGSVDAIAQLATTWLDAGATIVGGCCGTTPAHIAALRRVIDQRSETDPR
jgi:S-methylmethionine-dependent homocysteine/selenocysteine methylase